MKKMPIIILSILLVSISILLILILNKSNISFSTPLNGTCSTLYFSGNDKANLVFLSSKSEAERYSNFLFTIKPYNKENFNVYYIDDYQPNCEIYKGIALLCYSKEVIREASLCPNDYIIIPEQESTEIRSSTYMNVISMNSKASLSTLPHELGHAIASLADEYTPASLPNGQQNCKSTCSEFNQCFQGCSESSLQRSIDSGLMKSLSSNSLGDYDENLISLALQKKSNSLAGNAVSSEQNCQNQDYFLISANYSNGNITFNSKSVERGCINSISSGPFSFKVQLNTGEFIENNFNPEIIFTDIQNEGEEQASGGPIPYEGEFTIKVPLISNSDSLVISRNNITLTNIKINDGDARPCLIY